MWNVSYFAMCKGMLPICLHKEFTFKRHKYIVIKLNLRSFEYKSMDSIDPIRHVMTYTFYKTTPSYKALDRSNAMHSYYINKNK